MSFSGDFAVAEMAEFTMLKTMGIALGLFAFGRNTGK